MADTGNVIDLAQYRAARLQCQSTGAVADLFDASQIRADAELRGLLAFAEEPGARIESLID